MDSFWDFFWFIISFFLLMAYLMVLFQILTDLFRDHQTSGWLKAVWVFFLIVLPLLTSLAYLIFRGQGMTARNLAAAGAAKHDTDSYIRSVAGGAGSPTDEIRRARELLESGVIDEQEYQMLKDKALT